MSVLDIIGIIAFIGTIISGLAVIIIPLCMINKELQRAVNNEKLRKHGRT